MPTPTEQESASGERPARAESDSGASLSPRAARWWLVTFVVVAILVRAGFLVANPHPSESSGLSAAHGEMAHNIVDHGRWFVTNPAATTALGNAQNAEHRLIDPAAFDYSAADRSPRYQPQVLEPVGEAVVLAGLWTVTGDERYVYLQVLQIVLDSAMVLLVFGISMRLYRRPRAALFAAALYAVFLPIAALMRIPHLDGWAIIWTITITALFVRALDQEGPLRGVLLVGLATGLGVYFRPGVLLLPIALALAAIPSSGWRQALRYGGVPLIVAALLMVPWTVRNYEEFHRFVPTRVGIGQNLWEGLGEVSNDFGAVLDDAVTFQQVQRTRPDLKYGTPAYDAYLTRKGIDAIEQHPGHYAKVLGRRVLVSTVLMANPVDTSDAQQPSTSVSNALRHPLEPLVFILALVTLVATRRMWRRHLFLVAVVLAGLAPYVVLHFESRYGLVNSFAYMILVGFGADAALAWVRARSRRAVPAPAPSG
jgi:4-amino-4-deoxy-L-arabinose transferase-like glycosyltransferase